MLDEGSDAQTRAGRPFIVQDHYEYVANAKTRAVGDTIDVRFHVINFADDGGFALISADSRTNPDSLLNALDVCDYSHSNVATYNGDSIRNSLTWNKMVYAQGSGNYTHA